MKRFLFFAVSISMLVGVAAVVSSQDEKASLVSEMERLSSELRMQRENQKARRELFENRKTILLEEIDDLKEREKELSVRLDTVARENSELAKTLEELEENKKTLSKKKTELEKVSSKGGQFLSEYVRTGLPIDVEERAGMFENLPDDGNPVEKLKLLWQFYIQEFRRTGEIELSSPLTLAEEAAGKRQTNVQALAHSIVFEDGTRMQGRILRLGSVGGLFISDDGKTGAFLFESGSGYVWRLIADASVMEDVRKAFDIASGRSAPELVTLQVQLGRKDVSVDGESGKGGEK